MQDEDDVDEWSSSDSEIETQSDTSDNGLNADKNTSTSKYKKKKREKRSPGTLFQLSQACRKTARKIAQTGLFVTVYDNINLMFRVAEQIMGRKSTYIQWKFIPNVF